MYTYIYIYAYIFCIYTYTWINRNMNINVHACMFICVYIYRFDIFSWHWRRRVYRPVLGQSRGYRLSVGDYVWWRESPLERQKAWSRSLPVSLPSSPLLSWSISPTPPPLAHTHTHIPTHILSFSLSLARTCAHTYTNSLSFSCWSQKVRSLAFFGNTNGVWVHVFLCVCLRDVGVGVGDCMYTMNVYIYTHTHTHTQSGYITHETKFTPTLTLSHTQMRYHTRKNVAVMARAQESNCALV